MSFFPNSSTEAQPQVAGLDLSTIMRQVYLWVALGLLVSFGISFLVGSSALNAAAHAQTSAQLMSSSIIFNPIAMLIGFVAYIALAFTLQPVIMRSSPSVGAIFYLLFTGVFGFMTSSIFVIYEPGTIATAFFVTAATFGAMTIYGYTTKADLTRLGSILIMALIGLIIATIVNIFARSTLIYALVNYAGVLIFVGLTAYDTQWIKNNAARVAGSGSTDQGARVALFGAFHLFLDFVNLFMFILRVMSMLSGRGGSRR